MVQISELDSIFETSSYRFLTNPDKPDPETIKSQDRQANNNKILETPEFEYNIQ